METILVVDDEKNYTLIMATLLSGEGYDVLTAERASDALKLIEAGDVDLDLILTDMTMPKMDGIELLARIKEIHQDMPVIMMTAYGTVEKAVDAMKKGAFDYITKPFKNEDLLRGIRKALEVGRLKRENRALAQALKEKYGFANIIGKSKPMQDIYRLIEKVAATRASVLITGESGTGKELIAKAIHYHSPRARGPLVAINCSALAESLLESELFGYEKGAFTDAKTTRKGRFELSDGGTIFLDEIGEMPVSLQVKLLRVLQERRFERVGGSQPIDVDVRVMAATNRDLKQEVTAGRFREDLFYRLNVVHIHVPPLRERTDDIPSLVAHFIKKYCSETNRSGGLNISRETMRIIFDYPWPGNVRELENTIERGVILCGGLTLQPIDLPNEILYYSPQLKPPDPNLDIDVDALVPPNVGLREALGAIEKGMIDRALQQANNVQAHAADLLGIKKNLMKYKVDKYTRPDFDLQELEEESGIYLNVPRMIPMNLSLPQALDIVEKRMIQRALKQANHVQAHAAEQLGITKNLIQYKLKKYKLL